MTDTIAVAGVLGVPAEVMVPARSMARIYRLAFELENETGESVLISHQAVETPTGANVSMVDVAVPVLSESAVESVTILYRDRRFWKAVVSLGGESIGAKTLGQALQQIHKE